MSNPNHVALDTAATLTRHSNRNLIDRYYLELMKENAKVNLVSRETSREDFDRLFAESLLPLDIISSGKFTGYLDIGSGGGIPAIPLLISGRVSGSIVLVERTQKKAAALSNLCQS